MTDQQLERKRLIHEIRNIQQFDFEKVALRLFRYQSNHCSVYQDYLKLLKKQPESISSLKEIPFLPIELFKKHTIKSGVWQETDIFLSSGTTGQVPSRHHVFSVEWYQELALKSFETIYGPINQFSILALLPNYLERKGSSLVNMVDYFIQQSDRPGGFFLYDLNTLLLQLEANKKSHIPTLLIGVSFALLDLAEQYSLSLEQDIIVMETGGMKGRRKELTRKELHQLLQNSFGVSSIHSEYGMTELFSQAYAPQNGRFYPAPTMKIQISNITDPFDYLDFGKRGLINVVDLANLDTISFIATQDLGVLYPDHSFEVLGRLDHSEIRGCNLMVA